MSIIRVATLVFALLLPYASNAQTTAGNSNLWPIHRDAQAGFRISYPSDWVVVPPKGRNVRFSVNPPDGPGNCNVVARPNTELRGLTQVDLNREIEQFENDSASWSDLLGVPKAQVQLISSRRARIHDIPAAVAVVETKLQNLEGTFTRKQTIAMTLTPGLIWSLNCGASSFKPDEARSRYSRLEPIFSKVFGSFTFLR